MRNSVMRIFKRTIFALILGATPVDWNLLGISLLSSAITFVVGLTYFRNTERYFADIL